MAKTVLWIELITLLAGCSTTVFRRDGFFHLKSDFAIHFDDPDNVVFINEDWRVENYTHGDDYKSFNRKKGRAYYGTVYVDRDDNGTTEPEKVYFSDLELQHRHNNGAIWVTTQDMLEKHELVGLDVLLRNMTESLSGTENMVYIDALGSRTIETQRFATEILEIHRIQFGPYEAAIATISFANLDQLRLNKNHRSRLVRIAIAKIDGTVRKSKRDSQGRVISSVDGPGKRLMIVGYSNSPEYFEESLPDFERFLELIYFKKGEQWIGVQLAPQVSEPEFEALGPTEEGSQSPVAPTAAPAASVTGEVGSEAAADGGP